GTYTISNNTVDSPTYAGVLFVGSGAITGVTFSNLLVSAPGTSGIETRNNVRGSATLTGSTYGTITNAAGANFVITSSGSGGATGAGGGGVTPAGPPGFTYVADENATYALPAVGDVAYGANNSFNYRYAATGSITFNNATFQDPSPGATKHGFYRAGPAGPAGYTYCAPDLGSFTLPSISDVAYGANGAFAYLNGKTGAITFNPTTFGGDPAPGVGKAGFYRAARPDLVVTAITWSPVSPAAGTGVTFTATIKNQGGGATPGGIKHGMAFSVDGSEVTWSDTDFTSLAPGATVSLTANGGTSGPTWAAIAGTHTIAATIDDQDLIAESSEANNTFSTSLTVGTGGGGGGGFPAAGVWYKILSRSSGKALEIGGQTTNDGAGADQWDYLSQGNQKWQFVATDGGYYEVVVQNSNKALDVDAASTSDHAKVQQWTYGGGANQQWAVVSLGGGFYKIVARHSGKVLDVAGAGAANGVQVYQNTYAGGTNQQWTIVTAN
ncbi:MAG TPA: RICIN domain-containing protein, partial [Kofleriaceae bacterium]